jgi:AraC-like DNA-binding protein
MASGSISTRVVARIVDFVARRGHDPEAFCRRAGVAHATLRDPNARVPYAVAFAIGEHAADLLDDDHFGLHLAQDVGAAFTFDAGALMLMASASVRAGLERMARLQRYWGDGERTKLVHVRGGMLVRYVAPGAQATVRRHSDECALGEIVVGLRVLTGHDATAPRAVRFRHAAPKDTREHRALFRCPIAFDQDHTEVELADATLDLPLPQANAAYCSIFEAQVERALASLEAAAPKGTPDDVRRAAQAMLAGGECSLAGTARVLGVSPRTLQRRLAEQGTTFGAIVDAVRRELALEYLARPLAVAEIAFLLGYAEPSAFHHAFKRWTGKTPEQARAAAPPR